MSPSRRWYRPSRLFAVLLVIVLAVPALSIAGKWKPQKEVKPLYYKMQSTQIDRRDRKTVTTYSVDLVATGEKDEKGNPVYKVTTTQERTASGRDLNGINLAFGGWGVTMGAAAGLQWMMYSPLFADLELAVGEKMSYFGGMLAKVTAKEKIAGREGFVVELYRKVKEENVKMAELVLDPEVPVAMRARSYDNKGKMTSENLMLEYKAR